MKAMNRYLVVLFALLILIPPSHAQTVKILGDKGGFVVPPGVTQLKIEAFGGGGSNMTDKKGGTFGGAGGGAYASVTLTVAPGEAFLYGCSAQGAQNNSASVTRVNGSVVVVYAEGGIGGSFATAGGVAAGGRGGLAANCIGTTKFSGGDGGSSNGAFGAGGGGGSAGPGGNGSNGASATMAGHGIGGAGLGAGGSGCQVRNDGSVDITTNPNGQQFGGGAGGIINGQTVGGVPLIRITY